MDKNHDDAENQISVFAERQKGILAAHQCLTVVATPETFDSMHIKTFAMHVHLLLCSSFLGLRLLALEIDPTTRQHSANDPGDWSGAITVKAAPGEQNWSATVIPEEEGSDISWLQLTAVPPGFLVYGMNENFGAEDRTALIDFGSGVRFKLVQSGRGATISKNAFSLGSTGGTDALGVTVLPGTTWRTKNITSWIHILTGPTGFGSDTVRFAVDGHTEVLPREGSFVVAGKVVRVSQMGVDLTLEPTQTMVGDKLSIISFNVTAMQSQAWNPVADVAWLTLLNSGPKFGNGTVTLSVQPNGDFQPRQGRVNVGSKTFLVSQAGNQNPTLSISPLALSSPREGAQGRVNVLASPGTPWWATSTVPWMQVVGGVPGTNRGTVAFVVSPNNSLVKRQGVIEVVAADPLPAPNLRRGLAVHLVFESAELGDNLIIAQSDRAELGGFRRVAGRNGGQALRFTGTPSWDAGLSTEETVSFWFSVDYATRLGTVAKMGGHELGVSAEGKLTLDGVAPGVAVVSDKWYQVIGRRSGVGLELFFNGDLLKQWAQASDGLVFNPTGTFLGRLDDFRMYKRALAGTEIWSLYTDELAGNGMAIYGPTISATEGGLPLVGRLRRDVNTIDAVSGRQWDHSERYKLVMGNYTWYQAKNDAESRGGVLASTTATVHLKFGR